MSTFTIAQQPIPSDTDHTSRHSAQFAMRWLLPSTAVVSAHGELDAANAPEFADYSLRQVQRSGKLVLDLNAVQFFGTACFPTLHTLNVRCAAEGVYWALAPSKAVSRVLQLCDPDSTLPTCPNVAAALSMLRGEPRQLQLVTASD